MAAASSFTDDSEQREIHKISNWEDCLFFKQIKRDREEYNSSMGRKYNLNFNKEDIFDVKDEDFDSNKGKRSHVVWQPIIKNSNDMVRWNSYEVGSN